MAKVVKVKAGETITPDRIEQVIELLNTGGTKKSACDILGIRYNTSRLQKIIEEYSTRKEAEQKLKDKKKGTAVEKQEALDIIKDYLETGSIEATAKSFYRTPYIVSTVLEFYGARLHNQKSDYFKPILLPEICVVTSFSVGEYVWSARYNALAIIKKEVEPEVYAIKVLGKYERDAYQRVEDLGSLRHLEALGINFKNIRIYEHVRMEQDD
jgi:DNA invertase Pin-like site-specific DNA recombinase